MSYTAVVITVSDKCSTGERQDTSGPAICSMLKEAGYSVVHTAIVPDDIPAIRAELTACADEKQLDLIITTGGTGLVHDAQPRCQLIRHLHRSIRSVKFIVSPAIILMSAGSSARSCGASGALPGHRRK